MGGGPKQVNEGNNAFLVHPTLASHGRVVPCSAGPSTLPLGLPGSQA